MSPLPSIPGVHKMRTGIPGFDEICIGGLPAGRTTLVAGTAGSAKTVFSAHFLAAGITDAAERGVFVTFEESPASIRENLAGFGWNVAEWERAGKWKFVDASPDPAQSVMISGRFDFGALLARVERAVVQLGAQRVCLDSVGSIFHQFADTATIRTELHRLAHALSQLGVTTIVTMERDDDYGPLARFGVAEFVADNVVLLRNALDAESRRRTVEVVKFRGTSHRKGEYPFSVIGGTGVVVLPLSSLLLEQGSTEQRITTGNDELDAMCSGGLFKDSLVLVSGPTGTGKTLLATTFLQGAQRENQRALMCSFEEGREQLYRNAQSWGLDLEHAEAEGNLRLHAVYPELQGLEDHLIEIRNHLDEYEPDRVVIDSLSALQRVADGKGFREFMIALTSMLKEREICTVMTAANAGNLEDNQATGTHVSTITDAIIILRYVEFYGEIRRGLTLLKMRGSNHDHDIREFTVGSRGLQIGDPFRNINGILSGNVDVREIDEMERIRGLFGPSAHQPLAPFESELDAVLDATIDIAGAEDVVDLDLGDPDD